MSYVQDDGIDPNPLSDAFIEIIQKVCETLDKDPEMASHLLYIITGASTELVGQFGGNDNFEILRAKALQQLSVDTN